MSRLERILKAVELLNNEDKHFDAFVEEFYKVNHPAGAPTYTVPAWLPNRQGHGANRNLPAKNEAEQHLQKQLDKTPTGDNDLTDDQHEIGRRYLPVMQKKSTLSKLFWTSIGSGVASVACYLGAWTMLPDYKVSDSAVKQEIREHQSLRQYGIPYKSPAQIFEDMQEGRSMVRTGVRVFGGLLTALSALTGIGYALKKKK